MTVQTMQRKKRGIICMYLPKAAKSERMVSLGER